MDIFQAIASQILEKPLMHLTTSEALFALDYRFCVVIAWLMAPVNHFHLN